jgi:hypothetical protein
MKCYMEPAHGPLNRNKEFSRIEYAFLPTHYVINTDDKIHLLNRSKQTIVKENLMLRFSYVLYIDLNAYRSIAYQPNWFL